MLGVKMAKLTDQIIFNKSFNVEFKGYSTLEVDTFLDQVILDYQSSPYYITQSIVIHGPYYHCFGRYQV